MKNLKNNAGDLVWQKYVEEPKKTSQAIQHERTFWKFLKDLQLNLTASFNARRSVTSSGAADVVVDVVVDEYFFLSRTKKIKTSEEEWPAEFINRCCHHIVDQVGWKCDGIDHQKEIDLVLQKINGKFRSTLTFGNLQQKLRKCTEKEKKIPRELN